jgi:hypothetical protein
MIELLEIEHECILRNSHDDCDRDCADCDLVQDDEELHEMYTDVIALVKKQEPIAPSIGGLKEPDGSGTWWYLCGKCKLPLAPKERFCRRCGQAVKWNE